MGAEWCVDYVKGSVITDQTLSLPGRVEADCTFTGPGRRGAHAHFCFPLTVCMEEMLQRCVEPPRAAEHLAEPQIISDGALTRLHSSPQRFLSRFKKKLFASVLHEL